MNKRQPAYIVSIQNILLGQFNKTEGWEPNYIVTNFGMKISRVNIMGIVVEKDNQQITIDDSTGIIRVRSFDVFSGFDLADVGKPVMIIGKVREYGEIYLSPEILKPISSELLEERKKEWELIKNLWADGKIIQEEPEKKAEFKDAVIQEEETKEESALDKIITFIESNDSGSGVSRKKILEAHPDVQDVLERLILEGDIFEVKPDTFKVLK